MKCGICDAIGESHVIDTWDGPRLSGPCGLPKAFPEAAVKLRVIRFGQHEAVRECPRCGAAYEQRFPCWDNEVGDTHHHVELKRLSPRAAKKLVAEARELFAKRLRKIIKQHEKLMKLLSDEEIHFLDYHIIRMGTGIHAGQVKDYFNYSAKEEQVFLRNLEGKGVIHKNEDQYGGTYLIKEEWQGVFLTS